MTKRRRPTRLRAYSPLRFSIIGLAILVVPKVAQHYMCDMVQATSPRAMCAIPALPSIILIIGWTLIIAGALGVAYKLRRDRD